MTEHNMSTFIGISFEVVMHPGATYHRSVQAWRNLHQRILTTDQQRHAVCISIADLAICAQRNMFSSKRLVAQPLHAELNAQQHPWTCVSLEASYGALFRILSREHSQILLLSVVFRKCLEIHTKITGFLHNPTCFCTINRKTVRASRMRR